MTVEKLVTNCLGWKKFVSKTQKAKAVIGLVGCVWGPMISFNKETDISSCPQVVMGQFSRVNVYELRTTLDFADAIRK